jgi:hypothetical protein
VSYADDTTRIADGVLRAELDELRTLEDVLEWMKERELHGTALSVITQDEFNHDVLVAIGGTEHVAFGVT